MSENLVSAMTQDWGEAVGKLLEVAEDHGCHL